MILFETLILNFLKKVSNSLFAMTVVNMKKEGIHELKSLASCGPSLLVMSVNNNIDKSLKMY